MTTGDLTARLRCVGVPVAKVNGLNEVLAEPLLRDAFTRAHDLRSGTAVLLHCHFGQSELTSLLEQFYCPPATATWSARLPRLRPLLGIFDRSGRGHRPGQWRGG